jgi:hypothetical protein
VIRGRAQRHVEAWVASLRRLSRQEKGASTFMATETDATAREGARVAEPSQEPPVISKSTVYDISTFRPEAPELPALVEDLFCSRDEELARALDVLRANLDVNGERAAGRDKRPWVIHGDSRSGKSHLARRLMLELPDGGPRVQIKLSVREDLDAAVAMRKLLDELVSIYARTTPQGAPAVDSRLLDLGSLLGGHPTAGIIARACAALIGSLAEDNGLTHVLILFDDVDLLESYADHERNGRAQRAALSSAIAELVSTPRVDVILTARSWYADTMRECDELVRLDPMTEDELMAIHDRQLAIFAPRRPCDFLDKEALKRAAAGAGGLPGLFLGHLRTALHAYKEEPDWSTRDASWYLDAQLKDFQRAERLAPEAGAALRKAVSANQWTLNVEDRNVLIHTPFQNMYIIQSYYSETTLSIAPLAKDMIILARARGQ